MPLSDADRALFERAYDLLRLSRLNAGYYEARLARANRLHLFFEVTIALGTTGSIGALAIWQGEVHGVAVGTLAWGILAGAATVLAVLKPILAPAKQIEVCTRQHSGWLGLHYGIDKLLMHVRQEQGLTRETRRRFDTLYDRSVQLHLEDEKSPDIRLLTRLQQEVIAAMPPETFWLPEDSLPGPAEDGLPPAGPVDLGLAGLAAAETAGAGVVALQPAGQARAG